MSEIIVAVYENGVLRPVTPVSLSEGETVRLRIVPEVSPGGPKTEQDKALQAAADRGVLSLPPKHSQLDPAELARREQAWREQVKKIGPLPGKPLSETVIEGRGPW